MENLPSLAFVGAGRAGTALALRFYESGCTVSSVTSRTQASAAALAKLTDSHVTEIPEGDIIFLTVPDDSLAQVASHLATIDNLKGAVVHTSGVHNLNLLKELGGRAIGSFHPVFPFRKGTRITGNEGFLVGIEASEKPLESSLATLAQLVGGRPSVLKSEYKRHYHAAAVFASNYQVTLFHIALQLMRDSGVSEDNARHALLHLMEGNLENLRQLSPARALTGPIARGDAQTITFHRAALDDTEFGLTYRELARQTINLAPDLSSKTRQLLHQILED